MNSFLFFFLQNNNCIFLLMPVIPSIIIASLIYVFRLHFFHSLFSSFKPWCVLVIILFIHSPTTAFGQATNDHHSHQTANLRTVIKDFFQKQAQVHYIYNVALSPDATSIAWNCQESNGQVIYKAGLSHPENAVRVSASILKEAGKELEPQWSPDGKEIAFLSDARSKGQVQLYITSATSSVRQDSLRPLTHFDGYVSHLKWSPDGSHLSVLYVEKASRRPSPMAAENKAVGLIDSLVNTDIQRIAVINRLTGKTQQVTPWQLYIFEYDWSPNSKQFVYSAAPPPGDDNWYIAKLYQQSVSEKDTIMVYQPLRQIALPRWSPDGKRIAFIEGLMSDQGGTGGEIYTITPGDNGKPLNLTPGRTSTPAWFTWRPDGNMLFTEFTRGSVAIQSLNTGTKTTRLLWKADESIRAGNEEMSLSVAGNKDSPVFAFMRTSWNMLPEAWAGSLNKLTKVTNLNRSIHIPMPKAANIEWINEKQPVQGWLLYPQDYNPSKRYRVLVCVHGGPAWITTPTWSSPDFNTTVYTQFGCFVFYPNPRGSYGQGEKFTLANRRDWGFGDLSDIIGGLDTVIARFPIDGQRAGIFGWSYGGATAMFAVTQTNRFKAAVAGAGAGDWLSYYGQNSIDKWMRSYFDASPYEDPSAYARSSAMTYIKQAKTPTLVLVGERDGEAPPPQSFQFWHALKELHVPTQLMVYPDEGHSFFKSEDRIDVSARTIEWFNKYLKP